jgi:hypothetical protein
MSFLTMNVPTEGFGGLVTNLGESNGFTFPGARVA